MNVTQRGIQRRSPSRTDQLATVRVGRQGIYDEFGALFGYELLFRRQGANEAHLTSELDGDVATAQVISATFGEFGIDRIAGGRPLFVNLTRGYLVGRLPLPCAAGQVVLEVLEDVVVDDELLAGLVGLRERGYRIAVDDFAGEADRLALVELADFVKVDREASRDDLEDVIALVHGLNRDVPVVVERIEDREQWVRARDAGAQLFQGWWLDRPLTISGASVEPRQVTCLRLVQALMSAETPARDIEALVAGDPALALRVLRTVNSAALRGSRNVTSLGQAIGLLGRQQLASWVVLMVLGGLTSGERGPLALVLVRAHTCRELLPEAGDMAFMTGLLSGLAEVLGESNGELAAATGVGPSVLRAVVSSEGALGSTLDAVLAYENDDPDPATVAPYSYLDVSRAHLTAAAIAETVLAAVDQEDRDR